MQSTPSSPSLPGPLWPRVVAPDRVLSVGQIELKCVLMLNWIVWNGTVLLFKCVEKKHAQKWIVLIRTVWLNWIALNRNFFSIKLCTYAKLNCLK